MRFSVVLICVLIIAAIVGGLYYYQKNFSNENSFDLTKNNMILESPVFKNNENLPEKYTCDGEGVNPPLKISETPENAKSLVLIIDDPDAPIGTYVHWTVWNIDPKTEGILENSVPQNAVEGETSSGQPGYASPCPPAGTHRYVFKIFALDTSLDLLSETSPKELEKAIEPHVLGYAELIGLYGRK